MQQRARVPCLFAVHCRRRRRVLQLAQVCSRGDLCCTRSSVCCQGTFGPSRQQLRFILQNDKTSRLLDGLLDAQVFHCCAKEGTQNNDTGLSSKFSFHTSDQVLTFTGFNSVLDHRAYDALRKRRGCRELLHLPRSIQD